MLYGLNLLLLTEQKQLRPIPRLTMAFQIFYIRHNQNNRKPQTRFQ